MGAILVTLSFFERSIKGYQMKSYNMWWGKELVDDEQKAFMRQLLRIAILSTGLIAAVIQIFWIKYMLDVDMKSPSEPEEWFMAGVIFLILLLAERFLGQHVANHRS